MTLSPDLRTWSAAVAGDRDAFTALVSRHYRELEVHCYRMLGSAEEAEDLVQETLLRAWRRRETFGGRSSLRAWLYGIATNACLDALEKRARRLLPPDVTGPADPLAPLPPASDTGWLEPFPDRLLDEITDAGDNPYEAVVERETIELAFMVAIQHLPPRQRAVLILRDVLGWSARETAATVDATVIAANSALQRARETLRDHLPERRADWPRTETTDAVERSLLERYMIAWDRNDLDGLAALLADDIRASMPPTPGWYEGREAMRAFLAAVPMAPGASRKIHVPTRANRQPAFALFEAGTPPRPLGVEVLRIVDGRIAQLDVFLQPELVERFAVAPPA